MPDPLNMKTEHAGEWTCGGDDVQPTEQHAANKERRCPGPQQHGHPLVYESHCEHGETHAHVIRAADKAQWRHQASVLEENIAVAKTLKEWTPELLSRLFDAECSPEEGINRICALHNAALAAEREKHCRDCCCARSWEALGVTESTGMSIPEHIQQLREQIKELEAKLP